MLSRSNCPISRAKGRKNLKVTFLFNIVTPYENAPQVRHDWNPETKTGVRSNEHRGQVSSGSGTGNTRERKHG